MQTATLLLEIIERHSRKGILPIKEHRETLCYEGESPIYIEDRAKRRYLGEIETRIQYEPRLRELLKNKDGCIDCTIVD